MKNKWDEIYKKEIGSYSWEPTAPIKKFCKKLKQNLGEKKVRILDLGCGIAQNSIYLASKGHIVVGVDVSNAALQTAAVKVNLEKIQNVILLHGNMRSLPFPNEHFEVVLSTNTLHHGKLKNIKTAA